MNASRLKWPLLVTLVLVGAAVVILVRWDNRRLRGRVIQLRAQSEHVAALRAANTSTRTLLARAKTVEVGGAQAIAADLSRLQAEVKELERRAGTSQAQVQAQAAADAEQLAHNRDPEKGLVRLEHFREVGQATPAAAFQTFGWAALKGEDDKLARLIAFSGDARVKAEAVVAALPAATRAKYATPEKLTALFFAAALTAQPAAQIVATDFQDPHRAVLSVRGLTEKIQKVPLQWDTEGWRIVVPPSLAEKLGGWALGESAAKKK